MSLLLSSFYTKEELENLGFKFVGTNVSISRKSSFYNVSNISIGDNVRIDDFCILSGNIIIGSFVHIAAYSSIFSGEKGVFIKDFVNISSRVCIYGKSDDYSGQSLTSPLISDEYKNITDKIVILEKFVIVGTGSTILPGCILSEGSAVGAMSLINQSLEEYSVWAGIPAKFIKKRNRQLESLTEKFLAELKYE
ncbi:acyltransferase [Enterococcus casseliflavus]|uniref:acyltransferase n=1 Tax=Enterococcus TaxID=1350 RepID=UPI000353CB23|nr:bacterial transferase hexapeptide repeat protein [Enterococcus faecalis 06-MB-DW-09]